MTTLSDKAHAVRDAAVTRATMLSRYLDLRAWLTEAKALLFDSGDYDKPLPESEQVDFERKVAKFIRWLGEYESLVRQLAEMPGALASATCACGGLVLAPWDKECLNCWQARR